MKLRLLIPAAIAAFATYTALVRDEARLATSVEPHDDRAPAADSVASTTVNRVEPPVPAPPALPEPSTASAFPAAHTPAPPEVSPEPAPRLPSPYDDLSTPEVWDPDQPSVYDLLAGKPPSPVEADPRVEPESHAQPSFVDEPVQLTERRSPAETPSLSIIANEPTVEAEPASDPTPPTSDPWAAPLDEGRFALGGWAAAAGHSMVSAVTFRKRLPADITPDRIVLSLESAENVPDNGLVILSDPGFAPDRDGFTVCLVAADPGPFSAAGSYRVLPAQGPVSA